MKKDVTKIKGMTLKKNIEFMWDTNYNVYIGFERSSYGESRTSPGRE